MAKHFKSQVTRLLFVQQFVEANIKAASTLRIIVIEFRIQKV